MSIRIDGSDDNKVESTRLGEVACVGSVSQALGQHCTALGTLHTPLRLGYVFRSHLLFRHDHQINHKTLHRGSVSFTLCTHVEYDLAQPRCSRHMEYIQTIIVIRTHRSIVRGVDARRRFSLATRGTVERCGAEQSSRMSSAQKRLPRIDKGRAEWCG